MRMIQALMLIKISKGKDWAKEFSCRNSYRSYTIANRFLKFLLTRPQGAKTRQT
jgi:hypothetical protein